jgi:hypothetical protein
MCYLPPGPRCSHHAHQEWMKAVRALEKETDVSRKLLLQEKVDSALKAYHSTPRGQNELKRTIALLSGEQNTDVESQNELTGLKLSLKEGEISRANQLLAYTLTQENKDSSIRETIGTNNKQQIAVAVVLDKLISRLEKSRIFDAHVVDADVIEISSVMDDSLFKILVLAQKHQSVYDVLESKNNGDIVFSVNPPKNKAVVDIVEKHEFSHALNDGAKKVLEEWVLSSFKKQNIKFFVTVDVRTERAVFLPISELFSSYTMNFKKQPKLGGTSSYRHGRSGLLLEELSRHPFADADVQQVVTKKAKKTYLFNAPVITDMHALHTEHFYFAPVKTETDEIYYEVKNRHISNRTNLFLALKRNTTAVLADDFSVLHKALRLNDNERS